MAAGYRLEGWQLHDAAGRRKYVNDDELLRFLRAADRLDPARRALCYLIAYTGCRISEALALTVHQLEPSRGTVTFRTLKRRRPHSRTLPVPALLVAMLCELRPAEDGRLWQLHRVTAWKAVKEAMHRARIAGPMACPKGLRHGFGMRAAARNIPVNLIQRWLGHASPLTTAIYLDAVDDEERRFAGRMWPSAEGAASPQGNASISLPGIHTDAAALAAALHHILDPLLSAHGLALGNPIVASSAKPQSPQASCRLSSPR
jgi:integrase/recombinase XerD